MNSFRTFVRKHLSTHSLLFLFVCGFIGLGVSGKVFMQNVDTIFTDISVSSYTSLHTAFVNKKNDFTKLPNTPPPSLKVPNRSFAFGEKSEEVLLLQNFLQWRGFWPKDEPTTGYFGPLTLESVKKYQETQKIEAEGVVGPKTREAWKNDLERASE